MILTMLDTAMGNNQWKIERRNTPDQSSSRAEYNKVHQQTHENNSDLDFAHARNSNAVQKTAKNQIKNSHFEYRCFRLSRHHGCANLLVNYK